jgi:hypothetical protein
MLQYRTISNNIWTPRSPNRIFPDCSFWEQYIRFRKYTYYVLKEEKEAITNVFTGFI